MMGFVSDCRTPWRERYDPPCDRVCAVFNCSLSYASSCARTMTHYRIDREHDCCCPCVSSVPLSVLTLSLSFVTLIPMCISLLQIYWIFSLSNLKPNTSISRSCNDWEFMFYSIDVDVFNWQQCRDVSIPLFVPISVDNFYTRVLSFYFCSPCCISLKLWAMALLSFHHRLRSSPRSS